MAPQSVYAFEPVGHQAYPEMAGARGRAGMSGMQMRFVDELTIDRFESCVKCSADALHTVAHCGSFTYFESIRLCAITKASIRPVKPKSLKLTQKLAE